MEFLDTVLRPNVAGKIRVVVTNPEKKEIVIRITLPDGLVTEISTNKEIDEIPLKLPPLKEGKYELPFKIFVSGSLFKEGRFSIHVREIPKFRR